MNSTSIYILVALHPIITLTNMPNTAMEATELLKEIQKHDSQQAFRCFNPHTHVGCDAAAYAT